MLAEQIDQPRFAKLAKIIFRLGHTVGVTEENLAPVEFDRSLVITSLIKQADDRSAAFQTPNGTVFAHDDGRQVASIAVGQLPLRAVVNAKEQRRVLLGRRAFVELMIQ